MRNFTKPGEHGRASSRRKTATVLRLLRGKDLELDSCELGVTAANRIGWEVHFPPLFSNSASSTWPRSKGRSGEPAERKESSSSHA
jgi:hypothetical protein